MELAIIVQQKSLLTHPFYQLWLQGKLPMSALQKYTTQYYQLVEHLPKWISLLHTNCSDISTRKILIHNLMEEELGDGNGGIAHTDLWVDFGEEVGASREEVIEGALLPETKEAIETIQGLCASSLGEGAAALFAYESQVPAISEEKIGALAQYGITSAKALRFFEVHKTADIKHTAVWDALARKHRTGKEEETAGKVADALWTMFDGMYREYVPEELKCGC
ncbi:TPA: CADD family putative folate metabolism protein [Candidatus Woesearchaeota archaeon]|nr:TenA family transcriptional regulator [archaeon]HIJ11010.1 CADD family putative folate metabolism protein [Candidatus Woesearchaeota archaeon]